MKVTVIGGSGFLGTRLITLLREGGHDLVNLDLLPSGLHDDVTVIGDVRDQAVVRGAVRGSSVVVLLAAQHRDDVRPVSLYDEVNVGGARVVAAAAAAEGVPRIVFTSSVAVYGLELPHPSELSPTKPFNDYGRTKLAAEGVLTGWAEADPARALAVIRPCVIFGEDNRGNVWTLANQVASGRFFMIGKGENRKSMAYVGNVTAFLARTVTDDDRGVSTTNYADKPDLTTKELIDLITAELGFAGKGRRAVPPRVALSAGRVLDVVARFSGRTFPISAVRVQKFVAETTVDTARLEASGFLPEYTLAEGLRRTLAAEFPERRAHSS